MRVAQVLADRPALAEAMLGLISHIPLRAVDTIEVRLAGEQAAGDEPERRGVERAGGGQVLECEAVLLPLEVGQEGDAGGIVRTPGQRGRDEVAAVPDMVDLGAGVQRQPGHAIEQGARLIDRAGQVGTPLDPTVAAGLDRQLTRSDIERPLADEIDEATGHVLPVQHRRRPTQDLDAIKAVGVHLGRQQGIAAIGGEPVDEGHGIREAADQIGIDPLVGAAIFFWIDARHVAQRLPHALRALRVDLAGGDDRDGLRRLDQRGRGLGADTALHHRMQTRHDDIAAIRPFGLVLMGFPDAHGPRCRATAGRCRWLDEDVAAPTIWLRSQGSARQQPAQRPVRSDRAADRRAGPSTDERAIGHDDDPGRLSEARQRAGQRLGRQIEAGDGRAVLRGRRRGDQHGAAAQQRAEPVGNGHRIKLPSGRFLLRTDQRS